MRLRFLFIVRVVAGIASLAIILALASRAVRDCTVAPYVYENCLWIGVRDTLHLPQSKLLRAAALEIVGLSLLAGVYLVCRHVFPRRTS
jgi:hypothetical protein